MKKVLIGLVSLFMGLTVSAKTYTNNLGFGVRLPFPQSFSVDDTRSSSVDYSPCGIDVQYLGYFSNGLSLKGNFDLAFSSMSSGSADFTSAAVTERLGVGYGFLRTEKLYFGLLGFLGYDFVYATNNDARISTTYTFTRFVIGADPTLIFTPGKKFSLYASFALGAGFGNLEAELVGKTKYDLKPSFVTYPAIGMSWKF